MKFKVTCGPELSPVCADRRGFVEAVQNLVVNAVEAVGAVGRVELSVTSDVRKVCIRVTDSGSGVPDELASQVFELFFSTKSKGSGIGLSQVHFFCDTHDGNVSLDSDLGRTTFTMDLPASRASGGTG